MNGFLSLNKPSGVTSRAVVDRVERWFPKVRVGHAGTLDPRATGVLVIALGAGTRLIEYIQRMGKTYRSLFHLGATSDTDDADGVIQAVPQVVPPLREQVHSCLDGMIGEREQVPPALSAVWVEGKRAYQLARRGKAIELAPRKVRIDSIQIHAFNYPTVEVEIDCGKGTYIRSIARDLGKQLSCGAYVQELCRTRVGPFTLEQSLTVKSTAETVRLRLFPLSTATRELTQITLVESDLRRLHHGLMVAAKLPTTSPESVSEVAVVDEHGRLHAIALWKAGRVKPTKSFAAHI